MAALLDQLLTAGFLAATLRIATPLILATLGEMLCERSGVLNLGIEGTMLLGAMTGFTVTYFTGSLVLGALAALLAGAVVGLLLGVLTVSLGLSQHVSGIGVTLFVSGLAFFCYRLIFGQPATAPKVTGFATHAVPFLSSLPVVGQALFDQFTLVYAAFLAVPLAAFALFRTPWGLALRMVGENPQAAASAGVSVAGMRYAALGLGGALMALAGAFLCMAQYDGFTFGVISGRGWVAVALVVFGQWNPWRCAAGALLFAVIDAAQLRMQAVGLGHVPYELFLVAPFVLTIVAMALVSRNSRAPAALLKPYRKEER